ncbi:hypothetical protein L1887_39039 [Cichorium endivia]|nr:hypothetical protein L1887_39039 [Cichorium endivia]
MPGILKLFLLISFFPIGLPLLFKDTDSNCVFDNKEIEKYQRSNDKALKIKVTEVNNGGRGWFKAGCLVIGVQDGGGDEARVGGGESCIGGCSVMIKLVLTK